jgi:hypothetical protein
MISLKSLLTESVINEATMSPVRKVVNAILKKHGIVPMKTTSTSVRGFHNIQRGGYRYEGNYFLGFYGVTQDIIDKVGAEMKKAGVKDVDVRKGIISADFTKTGLKESVNEGLYFVGYNKGRGQGIGVFKDSYSSYKDAKKAVEKLEKERGGSYNQIAYYVADKDGKFVRESVTEAKFKSPDYIITSIPASAIPQTNISKADVGLGLAMGDEFGMYSTLNNKHYKLDYHNGKVALVLSKVGKLAVRVRSEKDPKYLAKIEKFVNDYLTKFSKNIKKTESVTEAKAPYEVYHKSYTSAIEAAREYAEKKGFEIDNDDAFRKIGVGPRKPSEGKTNSFSIQLSKDGKLQRKQLHIQVYGMKNSYELNAYIG